MNQVNVQIPNISGTATVPGIVSLSAGISIIAANEYGSGDHKISMSIEFLGAFCRNILEREMDKMRRQQPEIDYNKLQAYVSADDVELQTLGYTILGEHTKYVTRILIAQRQSSNILLESVIMDYVYNNRLNITGEIK
jgi:hypothetical protein